MSKKYLSQIFIVAVLVAGGFFVVGKILNNENKPEPLSTEPLSTDVPKADELTPIMAEKKVREKLPISPVLGRALNVTTSLSGPEKDEIIEQIKHFEASLINKPQNLHEWIQLGNLRKAIGDYLGAEMYWKYASVLMPNYHVPYNNLGNLYQYYLNDLEKAEEYYKKYIELSPKTEDPYKLLFDLYTTSYKEKENLALDVLEEGVKNATHNDYIKRLLENYKQEKGIE